MNYKFLTLAAASCLGIVMVAGIYTPSFLQESLLGKIFEEYAEPDWSQLHKRDIVKNSIPIQLVEENGSNCTATADHFHVIVQNSYFVRAGQLSEQLKYDPEDKTIVVPCDELMGQTSELHIWYVSQSAPTHADKFRYFITEWTN